MAYFRIEGLSAHSAILGRILALPRLILIASAALAVAGLTASPAGAGTPSVAAAPDFATMDAAGASRTLADYLNAKPILLEFMSPACPHCVEMAPILGRVHRTYADRVQFLTVAFDRDARKVQEFAQLEKHAWPYLMGTQAIIDAYHLEGVPAFHFLAADGRVVDSVVGSMPEQVVRDYLDALLKAH